ncbi:MAG: hypothetical protein UHH95_04340 [Oscillospiraceae bacterium]|nr:hypothetical protein [Oscillospiraceae bacterium]
MKGICKHYGEEFDCCKLLSDFSNPMTDLRPCTKDEYECKYYKPHTNFDRITENEETFVKWVLDNYHSVPEHFHCQTSCNNDCGECFKEWLQKECEG